jgi:hypothetical protein
VALAAGKSGEPHSLGGFFGTSADPANRGLAWPGGWCTDGWDEFTEALAELLTTLPADGRALDIVLGIGIQGWCTSAARDFMIYLYCDGSPGVPEPVGGLEAPGWTPVAKGTSPERLPRETAYPSGEFGPGEWTGPARPAS